MDAHDIGCSLFAVRYRSPILGSIWVAVHKSEDAGGVGCWSPTRETQFTNFGHENQCAKEAVEASSFLPPVGSQKRRLGNWY